MTRPYTRESAKIALFVIFKEKEMTMQLIAEMLLEIIHDIGALEFQNILEEIKRRK